MRFKRKSKAPEITEQLFVRVDKKTKNLTRRLQPGEAAVINHADIDRVAAETLVRCQPAVVINAAKSTTGKYPNSGPSIIVKAGVPLIDDCGEQVMKLHEGNHIEVSGSQVFRHGKQIARGTLQTEDTIAADQEAARANLPKQLEAFTENTIKYMQVEQDLIFNGIGLPDIKTNFAGKHALIVVRGYNYKEDLQSLMSYIREYHPVLVGVDGGADAILEAGLTPDMIVGDMDSVTDNALHCGAEVVVHAYRDGRAPGTERLDKLGVDYLTLPATGTSEDVAMLIADDKGADLIVALGTHATLVEFLDKGRPGMASTFLTRLRIGSKLVDAKGVSKLYQPKIGTGLSLLFVLVGVLAVGVALAVTPVGQAFYGVVGIYLSKLVDFIQALVGLTP
ncbi:MAG: putative cytokinetic ring protein SteA [Varibaculum sp.]|nr:putative cytokinetic ring protein SteA [Varibaculum sp.]